MRNRIMSAIYHVHFCDNILVYIWSIYAYHIPVKHDIISRYGYGYGYKDSCIIQEEGWDKTRDIRHKMAIYHTYRDHQKRYRRIQSTDKG